MKKQRVFLKEIEIPLTYSFTPLSLDVAIGNNYRPSELGLRCFRDGNSPGRALFSSKNKSSHHYKRG